MKPSNIALLYVVRLRARLGQELLALLGIAVGVSLLFAALVANASLTGSFERTMAGIVGDARFQVTTRGAPADDALFEQVRRLPGVELAVPVLEARAEVIGPRGRRSVLLIGLTPDFARINSSLARKFSANYLAKQRAIALPAPLADDVGVVLGQQVGLNIRGKIAHAPLGAQFQRKEIGELIESPLAVAPLAYAQKLGGTPGAITRVYVVPRQGRDKAVERELRSVAAGRANVEPADFDAGVFRQASQPTSQSTAMFSVFSAMVGFMFAFSAVLLTAPSRRQLITDLEADGYGPGIALRILLVDALVLGVVASVLGVLLGDAVSERLFSDTPGFLDLAFVFGPQRIVDATSVIVAVLGGIGASCIAVIGSALPAVVTMHDEVEDSAENTSRARERAALLVGVGTVLLIAGTVIVVMSPDSATVGIVGLVVLTASMLLLLPSLLRALIALLGTITRRFRGVVGFLAVQDLRDPATRVRSIAVAATGAVAVLASVALQGAQGDLQRGLDRTAHDLAGASELWAVTPGDANLLATTAFAAPSVTPGTGIASVTAYRGGFLDIGDRRVWVFGTPRSSARPIPRDQTLEGNGALVEKRLRAGGWAVVAAGLAREWGLKPGDPFTLPSPSPIPLRVAALSTNMGWPPGAIVINADEYKRAWGSDDMSALNATLTPGTSIAEGRAALRAALGPDTGLVVKTAVEREAELDAGSRQGLARLTQIAGLVLVSAMIAMAAAMAGLIWQRRTFLASVKIDGYGTGEVWRSLLLEASVLIGAGCVIGAAYGLLAQQLLSRALTSVTGFPVASSLAFANALLSCAAVTIAAVAIVGAFGYRAASIEPENGLRE